MRSITNYAYENDGAQLTKVFVPNIIFDPEGTIGKFYCAQTTYTMCITNSEDTSVYKGGIDSIKTTKAEDILKATPYVKEALEASMGIELLSEEEYRELQTLGNFDEKTSSWIKTPADIRKLGGALFCDRRYNTVFVYHNGASSYYAVRGFRGVLRV